MPSAQATVFVSALLGYTALGLLHDLYRPRLESVHVTLLLLGSREMTLKDLHCESIQP